MNTVEMQIQLVTKTQIPKNMFILYQGCVQKMHHGSEIHGPPGYTGPGLSKYTFDS